MASSPTVTITNEVGGAKVGNELKPDFMGALEVGQRIRIKVSECEYAEAILGADDKFTVDIRNGGPIVRASGLDKSAVEEILGGFFCGEKRPLRNFKWRVVEASGKERMLVPRAAPEGGHGPTLSRDDEERLNSATPDVSSYVHHGNGWIYILSNISMPGIVKIGRTDRTPTERAAELSAATGVPTRFKLHWEAATGNAELAEVEIHRILDDKRVNEDREFFRIDPDSAIDVVAHVCAAFPALGEGCDVDIQSSDDREDDLFLGSVQLLKQSGSIEPRAMRIKLGMSYDESYAIFNKMKSLGFIDSSGSSTQRF